MASNVRWLSIDLIDRDGSTQSRSAIRHETVDEYAAILKSKVEYPFPPIVVFQDAKTGECFIGDGWHRFLACVASDTPNVRAEVHKGTRRDAILHAVGANAEHGIKRSNDDKRKAVGMLLSDPQWSKGSNRWIAGVAKVSEAFVRALKKEMGVKSTQAVGMDGRTRDAPQKKETAHMRSLANEGGEQSQADEPLDPNDPEAYDPAEDPEVTPQPPDPQKVSRGVARTRHTDVLSEIGRMIREAKRLYLKEAAIEPDGRYLRAEGVETRMKQLLDSASGKIEMLKPSSKCHDCLGAGCKKCKLTGWILCTTATAKK